MSKLSDKWEETGLLENQPTDIHREKLSIMLEECFNTLMDTEVIDKASKLSDETTLPAVSLPIVVRLFNEEIENINCKSLCEDIIEYMKKYQSVNELNEDSQLNFCEAFVNGYLKKLRFKKIANIK